MRQLALVTVVGVFLWGAGSPLPAQNCPPGVIACTPVLDLGRLGVYDDSISDITYHAARKEVWAIEGPIPGFHELPQSRITVYRDDLAGGRRSFNAGFVEPAFGIAEIPSPLFHAGKTFVLSPDATAGGGLQPSIGIMDENGNLVTPDGSFKPILDPQSGSPPPGFFMALDVHPTEPEIALLDSGDAGVGAHIVFVDLSYQVTRGPFRIEGEAPYYGGGIAYNSSDTVLVISQFGNSFEARLAMEYSRETGLYTGRTVILDAVILDAVGGDQIPLAQGIDIGSSGQNPALFVSEIQSDALYALPLDTGSLALVPGPVKLSPGCVSDPDGRVHLTWTNNMGHDTIAVFENGVLVSVLDRDATDYVTTDPVLGKYEFCLETRNANDPSPIRVCCEGQSGKPFPFLDAGAPVGAQLEIAPQRVLGMASAPVIERKEDFRLYVVDTTDNEVQVLDYQFNTLAAETIVTDPPRQSVLGNLAASGIALLEQEVQGQKVPLYALLDLDGPNGGALAPSASIHFLKDTTLAGNAVVNRAGTSFQDVITIDFTAINAANPFLVDWDADGAGDLITLDLLARRIIKIRFNSQEGTLKAVSDAPVPMLELTPFTADALPIGQLSVLPSGHYLVSAGDPFDRTVNRAFLLTPLGPDPGSSARLVGQVEGLFSFSQFFPFSFLGHSMGAAEGYGLETAFFKNEGPDGAGVGATFYDLQHFPWPTSRSWIFIGNIVAGLTNSVSHPDLAAEPLWNEPTAIGTLAPLETGALRPTFAAQTPLIDFHYHLFNTSDQSVQSPLRLKLRVLLDGREVPELAQDEILIPPGRSLYRSTLGRVEKTLALRVENLGPASGSIRLLVGATGVKKLPPAVEFRRGDSDGSGIADVTDAISILGYLYLGGEKPRCLDAADVDDSGEVDLTDSVFLLNRLFTGGVEIPPPGLERCGPDPVADGLETCVYTSC